ncbi:MAG: 4-(cytidine 5'-diphospho)-2-C-methyl-D-erythritol kinase [Flavisolibacter sp.]
MIVFPNCKINIGLSIGSKRSDGFHNIDSILYPIDFHEVLEIIEDDTLGKAGILITVTGSPIPIETQDNLIYKAYHLLKKDFPDLPSLSAHIHKKIPSGAGLAGGSSDGAYTLQLINKKFNLGLNFDQLLEYALQLGSDCPFFMYNQSAHVLGRGEHINPVSLSLSKYTIVLVHSGIHISTAWAFSNIDPLREQTTIKDLTAYPVSEWKQFVFNDFEGPVFKKYPTLSMIKDQLYAQGATYCSLSGSGSVVYGIFEFVPQINFSPSYLIKIIEKNS